MADHTIGIEVKNVQSVQGAGDIPTIGEAVDSNETFKDMSNSIDNLTDTINKLIRENYQKEIQKNLPNATIPENVPTINSFESNIRAVDSNETFKDMSDSVVTLTDAIYELIRDNNYQRDKQKQFSEYNFIGNKSGSLPTINSLAANTGNIISGVAHGNIIGTGINTFSNLGNTISSFSKVAEKNGNDDLAKGLLMGGGGVAVAAILAKALHEVGNTYSNTIEANDELLKNYGTITNSYSTNSSNGLRLREKLASYNLDTGLETDEFVSLTNNFAKSGITDIDQAGSLARESALWSRRTGADLSQVSGITGLVGRMNGNANEFLSNSYRAARASGLENGQFGEFLEGIQSAMEQGISKGFKLSADDISKNLAYVSMLGDKDEFWKGKYGAQMYNSMSNSMANNTSLQNTSSLLLYRAASELNGGNTLETMKFIESGQWGNEKFLSNLKENVNSSYSNDKMSQIATYKEMFGLNWTGGEKVYDLMQKVGTNGYTEDQLQKDIDSISKDNNFLSDGTVEKNALNKINEVLVGIGETEHRMEISTETLVSKVDSIYRFMKGDEESEKETFEASQERFSQEYSPEGYDPTLFKDDKIQLLLASGYEKQVLQTMAAYWTDRPDPETGAGNGVMEANEVDMSGVIACLNDILEELKYRLGIEIRYEEQH